VPLQRSGAPFFAPAATSDGHKQFRRKSQQAGGAPDSSPHATSYSGILPCLRFGCGTRLLCSIRSALISFGLVSRGSITSSM
jgi:hypothetical protein